MLLVEGDPGGSLRFERGRDASPLEMPSTAAEDITADLRGADVFFSFHIP
jgi:hypothetical protein